MGLRHVLGIVSVLVIAGCSGDEPSGNGAGGAPGSGGAGGNSNGECAVNVDASAAPVSFKDDVMPIFGFGCAGDQCHSGSRPKGNLFLGPKCDFKDGTCTWPATPNTENPSAGQPITDADIRNVHGALREASATAPAVKRVVPGDPAASFLVDKIVGIQNSKGYACTNTDSASAASGACGGPMPRSFDSLCDTGSSGQSRVNTIVNWIAQGAEND